jgi:hypothetical protein
MKIMNKPKSIVVTGASAGLGRAIDRAFAREGTHVGLIACGHGGLEGARREVEEVGGKALAYPADVADAPRRLHKNKVRVALARRLVVGGRVCELLQRDILLAPALSGRVRPRYLEEQGSGQTYGCSQYSTDFASIVDDCGQSSRPNEAAAAYLLSRN